MKYVGPFYLQELNVYGKSVIDYVFARFEMI